MDLLRTHYKFQVDGNATPPAQAIILSKIPKISTVIVWRKAMITDNMQKLLSYAGTFEEDYGVQFLDVRRMYIIEDMISS